MDTVESATCEPITWKNYYLALEHGNFEIVKHWLKTNDFRCPLTDRQENTLELATFFGHQKIVQHILESDLWKSMSVEEKSAYLHQCFRAFSKKQIMDESNIIDLLLAHIQTDFDLSKIRKEFPKIYRSAIGIVSSLSTLETLSNVHNILKDENNNLEDDDDSSNDDYNIFQDDDENDDDDENEFQIDMIRKAALGRGNDVLRFFMEKEGYTCDSMAESTGQGCPLLTVLCSLDDKTDVQEELEMLDGSWIKLDIASCCKPMHVCCITGNIECLVMLVEDYKQRLEKSDDLQPLHEFLDNDHDLGEIMGIVISRDHLEIAKYLCEKKMIDLKYPHEWTHCRYIISAALCENETFQYFYKKALESGRDGADSKEEWMERPVDLRSLQYCLEVLDKKPNLRDLAKLLDYMGKIKYIRRRISMRTFLEYVERIPTLINRDEPTPDELKLCEPASKVKSPDSESPTSTSESKRKVGETSESTNSDIYHAIAELLYDDGSSVCWEYLPPLIVIEKFLEILPKNWSCECGLSDPFQRYLSFGIDKGTNELMKRDRFRKLDDYYASIQVNVFHAHQVMSLFAKYQLRPSVDLIRGIVTKLLSTVKPRSTVLNKLLLLAEQYDLLKICDNFSASTDFEQNLKWFEYVYEFRDEFLTKFLITLCGSGHIEDGQNYKTVEWAYLWIYANCNNDRRPHYFSLLNECHLKLVDPRVRDASHGRYGTKEPDDQIPSLKSLCRVAVRTKLRTNCSELNRVENKSIATMTGLMDELCNEMNLPKKIRDYLHMQWFIDNVKNFEKESGRQDEGIMPMCMYFLEHIIEPLEIRPSLMGLQDDNDDDDDDENDDDEWYDESDGSHEESMDTE